MKRKNKGFTLLELLVVIGIIGILISIAAVSYSSAQKRTRDARRKEDIKAIQNALEQAYADSASFQYPACTLNTAITSGNCAIGGYLPGGVPADPVSSGDYVYRFQTSTTTSYRVGVTLETGGSYMLNSLQ